MKTFKQNWVHKNGTGFEILLKFNSKSQFHANTIWASISFTLGGVVMVRELQRKKIGRQFSTECLIS